MELAAVPDIKAERIAWILISDIVCRHGTPVYVTVHHKPPVKSALVNDFIADSAYLQL